MIFKWAVIFLASVIFVLILFFFWAGSGIVKKSELSGIKRFSIKKTDYFSYLSPIKIMTCNCGYFSGMRNNLPGNPSKDFYMKNINEFYKTVKRTGAEIICLQEIDLNSNRSYYINQSEYLAEKLGFLNHAFTVNWNKRYVPFPYWPPSAHFGRMLSAQSVISRYPILNNERIILRKPPNPFYYNRFYLDRLIQDVKIKLGEETLVILNIHLEAFDKDNREYQAKYVIDYFKNHYKNRYPVIILGDFNSVPPDALKKSGFPDEPETDYDNEATIQLFYDEESLKEAAPKTDKIECTFPSAVPDRKLDYIFYTHKFIKFLSSSVYRIDSSDHLPLLMEFVLKRK